MCQGRPSSRLRFKIRACHMGIYKKPRPFNHIFGGDRILRAWYRGIKNAGPRKRAQGRAQDIPCHHIWIDHRSCNHPVGGRNPSPPGTFKPCKYYLSTGAGFQPSTVPPSSLQCDTPQNLTCSNRATIKITSIHNWTGQMLSSVPPFYPRPKGTKGDSIDLPDTETSETVILGVVFRQDVGGLSATVVKK